MNKEIGSRCIVLISLIGLILILHNKDTCKGRKRNNDNQLVEGNTGGTVGESLDYWIKIIYPIVFLSLGIYIGYWVACNPLPGGIQMLMCRDAGTPCEVCHGLGPSGTHA
jgi:hypothetical protein